MEDKKTKDENGDKGAVGGATMVNAETIAQIVSQTVATTMAALQQQQPQQHNGTGSSGGRVLDWCAGGAGFESQAGWHQTP